MSGKVQPISASTRSLPIAGALVLTFACLVDVGMSPGARGGHFFVCLLGLTLALGLLCGAAWSCGFWLLGFVPRPLQCGAWLTASIAAGMRLSWTLGAFKRLQGAYSGFAIGVLVACAAGGLLFGGLLCTMQPSGPTRRAFLFERPQHVRRWLGLGLITIGLLLVVADRMLFVGLYPSAHLALRLCGLFLGMFALALVHDWLRLSSLTRPLLTGAACLLMFVLLTLDATQSETLQAFAASTWSQMTLSAARDLTDFDDDGFSSLFGGGDCAPFNPRVNPLAREIPGNGIDDNCLLGDGHKRPSTSVLPPVPTRASPLDVVLITVDSLRRDRVGSYVPKSADAGRDLTPMLDEWARDGTVFRQAYSPGGWTSLAIPALMRGAYPRRLHWTRFYETSEHRLLRKPLNTQLHRGEVPTWLFAFPAQDPHLPLAQYLTRRGMHCEAVVDDGPSEILRSGTGVELGFDRYLLVNDGTSDTEDDATTATRAIAALQHAPASQRLFLWVHFFGVHSPSQHHRNTPDFGTSVADRYDHEVRYFDTQVGRLLAAIAQRTTPLAVFVTADHGEQFRETTRFHGYSLAEELIRIPLLARVPGWPKGESDALVSLVDLPPTILALTGTPVPAGLDGIDLASQFAAGSQPQRILLSDTWRFDVNGDLIADLVAAYDGRQKLVIDDLQHRASRFDQRKPGDPSSVGFGVVSDALSKLGYDYLEENGGMPEPSD